MSAAPVRWHIEVLDGPSRKAFYTAYDALAPLDVRIRVALTALARSGFPAQAELLSAAWNEMIPRLGSFDRELVAVAEALVDGPYPEVGDVPLTGVIDFSTHDEAARTAKAELLMEVPLSASTIRSLVGGAALAFAENPVRYANRPPR